MFMIVFSIVLALTDDGPFGLVAGSTPQQLIAAGVADLEENPKTRGEFLTKKVPRPADGIELYGVRISTRSGLCSVIAIGRNITSSSHGREVMGRFAQVREMLADSYGKPTEEINRLLPGSIWRQPQDWMMGLAKKERVLESSWVARQDAPLRNRIRKIRVWATSRGMSVGAVTVWYEFDNYDDCEQEFKAKDRQAF